MKILLSLVILLVSVGALPAQETLLRTGDAIEIKIGGVPSEEQAMINNVYNIDGQGNVNMPHIGNVRARGLSIAQLSASIQNAYKAGEIYTNPTIAIGQQTTNRFVNVGGEVKAPQRVPFTSDLTLFSSIQAAGGFTDFANRKKVVLLRGKSRTVYDTNVIVKLPGEDPKLEPGDQILVPSSPF